MIITIFQFFYSLFILALSSLWNQWELWFLSKKDIFFISYKYNYYNLKYFVMDSLKLYWKFIIKCYPIIVKANTIILMELSHKNSTIRIEIYSEMLGTLRTLTLTRMKRVIKMWEIRKMSRKTKGRSILIIRIIMAVRFLSVPLKIDVYHRRSKTRMM